MITRDMGYIPRHAPRKCRHMTREELERFMNVPVADFISCTKEFASRLL